MQAKRTFSSSLLPSRAIGVSALLALLSLFSAWAGAVTPESHKSRGRSGASAQAPGATVVRPRQVSVSWQTTRSRFLSSGPSTQTESYRETWRIEPRDDESAWLVSGRGRALVYGKGLLTAPGPKTVAAVVIGERDLARLIGLPMPPAEQEDLQVEASTHRLVPLAGLKGADVLVMKSSDDEQYTVQFEMGQTIGF